jgi:hypothetical protein
MLGYQRVVVGKTSASLCAVGASPSRRPKLPAALVQLKLITGRCNDTFCDQ